MSCGGSDMTVSLSTCPATARCVDQESTLANRRDAIVAAMDTGDGTTSVLVGHSGGGFDATLAADGRPDLVSHVVYLAAALPREGRTYPEAMAMRDSDDELGENSTATSEKCWAT